ncbi:MAG TPA: hypothetical protein VNL71_18795 [Chloroflexota bacterium]|nr:hypothetical protein [Chloroflexota bacterium]
MALPTLAQLTGQAVVPFLLLINGVPAVGLIAAFRGTGWRGDRRLATALGSLLVAAFFDWFVVLAAGTNASAFVLALLFAVPLLALALGVGSVVRASRSLGSGTRLPQPTSRTPGLWNGAHDMLLEEGESGYVSQTL